MTSLVPQFRNGIPLFVKGKLSFCEEDCDCQPPNPCEPCCGFMFWQDNKPGEPEPVVWGEFNANGDLFETLTYPGISDATVTETITIVVPTKFSRYICEGEDIEIELTYSTDYILPNIGADKYFPDVVPVIQWDRSWTANCNVMPNGGCDPGVSIDVNKKGLMENWANDVEEMWLQLTYTACYHEYENDPAELVVGSRNYGTARKLRVVPCTPEVTCCPHPYECADCCLYLTSSKILAGIRGLSVREVMSDPALDIKEGLDNMVDEESIIYYKEDPTGARMYVIATPAGGTKRTVCPLVSGLDDPTNAGNFIELEIIYIPSSLNPRIVWNQEMCISFHPDVWELAGSSDSGCDAFETVCVPTDPDDVDVPGYSWTATLLLKCYPFGGAPLDIARMADIVVQISDQDTNPDGQPYTFFEGMGITIPFGYCGANDYECCPDIIPECEDCCMIFDSAAGHIYDLSVDGEINATMPVCDDTGELIGSLGISIFGDKLCKGAGMIVSVDNAGGMEIEVCIEVTGDFEGFADEAPEADSFPSISKFCWDPAPAVMSVTRVAKCKDFYAGATVVITAGNSLATFEWKGCPETSCCCEEYVPCCGGNCYVPDATNITQLELISDLDDGRQEIYDQNGPSFWIHPESTIDVSLWNCPEKLVDKPRCDWYVPIEQRAGSDTVFLTGVWINGILAADLIVGAGASTTPRNPRWQLLGHLLNAPPGDEDCYGEITVTSRTNSPPGDSVATFTSQGPYPWPTGMTCFDDWVVWEDDLFGPRVLLSEFPDGFFDGLAI